MKYLKEVTNWSDSTPNHVYIFNEGDENVGYIIDGTVQKIFFEVSY